MFTLSLKTLKVAENYWSRLAFKELECPAHLGFVSLVVARWGSTLASPYSCLSPDWITVLLQGAGASRFQALSKASSSHLRHCLHPSCSRDARVFVCCLCVRLSDSSPGAVQFPFAADHGALGYRNTNLAPSVYLPFKEYSFLARPKKGGLSLFSLGRSLFLSVLFWIFWKKRNRSHSWTTMTVRATRHA